MDSSEQDRRQREKLILFSIVFKRTLLNAGFFILLAPKTSLKNHH
ncbi:hypothetical protein J558_0892 [Acinetobacter baumannii 1106579]|uniref:Uncharacterized protein n=1 Tax=Acinetobacter baumannii 21072 TaxID=1310697 RepID=A0A062IK79_ACIBA|nr:hypothetical protein ACINWCA92_0599 [Acinetobacter baumannii WC-A-92]EXB42724.1 hypothetical protein J540_3483 [Acinetobacter baumannii 1440422]EXC19262.1 hypothetical protein J533_0099 [Acinetobacter baumannii 4749]EXE19943.1 hypothetical protein J558_0892 [Acinetobacter baumannii 1106579]KCY18303.1 hypothetical protein J596_2213 [Acinetobacter baumannii 21072]